MYLYRLKYLRLYFDLSQNDVSTILKIDQRIYSIYEDGKRDIPINLILKLAVHYNVSSDYLLNLSNDKRIAHEN